MDPPAAAVVNPSSFTRFGDDHPNFATIVDPLLPHDWVYLPLVNQYFRSKFHSEPSSGLPDTRSQPSIEASWNLFNFLLTHCLVVIYKFVFKRLITFEGTCLVHPVGYSP